MTEGFDVTRSGLAAQQHDEPTKLRCSLSDSEKANAATNTHTQQRVCSTLDLFTAATRDIDRHEKSEWMLEHSKILAHVCSFTHVCETRVLFVRKTHAPSLPVD